MLKVSEIGTLAVSFGPWHGISSCVRLCGVGYWMDQDYVEHANYIYGSIFQFFYLLHRNIFSVLYFKNSHFMYM
jgi:hypothetical protein